MRQLFLALKFDIENEMSQDMANAIYNAIIQSTAGKSTADSFSSLIPEIEEAVRERTPFQFCVKELNIQVTSKKNGE